MKKFSVVLSILAAVAGLVGIYFAVVEYLKRKGYFSDEEECDECCDDVMPCEDEEEESMSFSEDDGLSFMGAADSANEEDSFDEESENTEEESKE